MNKRRWEVGQKRRENGEEYIKITEGMIYCTKEKRKEKWIFEIILFHLAEKLQLFLPRAHAE